MFYNKRFEKLENKIEFLEKLLDIQEKEIDILKEKINKEDLYKYKDIYEYMEQKGKYFLLTSKTLSKEWYILNELCKKTFNGINIGYTLRGDTITIYSDKNCQKIIKEKEDGCCLFELIKDIEDYIKQRG